MSKIIILDENTANKISAGEVVERPSSVVKELVENSLDAGAKNITVEIRNGGIKYIKVMDNGTGLEEGDVEIAFERHATSKIISSIDLCSVSTMGFRGEALASIASVSNIELVTKTKEKTHGSYIKLSGGTVVDIRQKGCPVGTTVIVKDLFFNTPARYKFLKKDSTEGRYVADLLNRIALGNPQVSFKFINNGSTALYTPGNNDLMSTIFGIYGKNVSEKLFKVQYTEDDIIVTGYAGSPEIARASRNHQTIFVNNRFVKDKIVTAAIDEAYKTLLMKNKYAFVVLNIDISSSMVDVNVHPAKTEVRFSNEQEVFRAVYHAIYDALLSKDLVRNIELSQRESIPRKKPASIDDYQQESIDIRYNLTNVAPQLVMEEQHVNDELTLVENDKMTLSELVEAKIIGQIFTTYILLETNEELILIDQHAAHERIIYESLLDKFNNSELLSQSLLNSVTIELTHTEINLVNTEKDFFNKLGFIFENFGNNSIVLRAVPYMNFKGDYISLFLDIIDIAKDTSKSNYTKLFEDALYIMACKAAVKANKKLDNLEIQALLRDISNISNPYSCPHGRPTMIKISMSELEKRFNRRS
jgi:DNA mismatch repair protein MutL